jgi:adenosylmethionine-8-amino-7-oxononanoate aminotransferase
MERHDDEKRHSYHGSDLGARAKGLDDDEKRRSYDDSNLDARTVRPTHTKFKRNDAHRRFKL